MRTRKKIIVQNAIIGHFLYIVGVTAFAQKNPSRIEPPFWWIGMENNQLQLLVHGEGIGATTDIELKPAHLMILDSIHKADNTNYVFVDFKINANTRSEIVTLTFKNKKKTIATANYELKERTGKQIKGIDGKDVIYLITPDRFVNGNPDNDSVEGLDDKLNRDHYNGRHGGDLQGIISKLDYMEDLGVTTLWLNPVLENAMPKVSYHGYAITDYYRVDPRYGNNKLYKKLSAELKSRDMKLIMDMVFNHSGSKHWWMEEPPFDDWIHFYNNYKITNHAMASIPDPHAVNSERELMEKGWFVSVMPDLNHSNRFMENYLIQNSIWWIEYANLNGIRMDTYPYNKKETMQRWAGRVLTEYPNFYLVGETWIASEAQEAYWAPQSPKADYNSGLTSITDFPLNYAILSTFKEEGDIRDLYNVLSKDYLYYKPEANKIFADNHDMDRFYYAIGENVDRFKNAMTFLLTTRGIPQIYYGTEILMRKHGEHGVIRQDFPGGWDGDERNAFTFKGRTAEENEAFEHVQSLLNWRKTSEAITSGSLKHYVPYDNIYIYSRETENETVVVIINNNSESNELDLSRFHDILEGSDIGKDVLSEEVYPLTGSIQLKGNSSLILTLSNNNNQNN